MVITMAVVGNFGKLQIAERMLLSLALIQSLVFEFSARKDQRNNLAELLMQNIHPKRG